jgi:hypothetical protein
MVMTVLETLTALFNKFITGLAIYAIGMSLAYAGYVGQNYDPHYDWCDPRFCCPPGNLDESK